MDARRLHGGMHGGCGEDCFGESTVEGKACTTKQGGHHCRVLLGVLNLEGMLSRPSLHYHADELCS